MRRLLLLGVCLLPIVLFSAATDAVASTAVTERSPSTRRCSVPMSAPTPATGSDP